MHTYVYTRIPTRAADFANFVYRCVYLDRVLLYFSGFHLEIIFSLFHTSILFVHSRSRVSSHLLPVCARTIYTYLSCTELSSIRKWYVSVS